MKGSGINIIGLTEEYAFAVHYPGWKRPKIVYFFKNTMKEALEDKAKYIDL